MGLEYFNNLGMRSFFQELEDPKELFSRREFMKCKIHDIVHDFAQFITKNECHVLDGIDYGQSTRINPPSDKARHLTWLGNEEKFRSPVLDFGRLRSFLAFSCERVVPLDLFHTLTSMRTVILSNCQLREVPTEVGSLIHMRYLDLSDNPFKTLPETICDLYYLETFHISRCRILSYQSLQKSIVAGNCSIVTLTKGEMAGGKYRTFLVLTYLNINMLR